MSEAAENKEMKDGSPTCQDEPVREVAHAGTCADGAVPASEAGAAMEAKGVSGRVEDKAPNHVCDAAADTVADMVGSAPELDASASARKGGEASVASARTRRKRLAALSCLLVLALLSVVAARQTLSATSREAMARNRVTFGGVEARVVETMPGPDGVEVPAANDDIPIGDYGKVDRTIRVENTGGHPVYVRVKLSFEAQGLDGEPLPLPDVVTYLMGDPSWVERDGWYYQDSALEPGERTPALVTGMLVDAAAARKEVGSAPLRLRIEGQGVQVENNAASALDAEGWPEEGGGR